MANSYFTHSANVIPKGSRASAAQVNSIADEIEVGLDKLPTESELKQNELNYSTDSGVANNYIITLGYVPTLSDGLKVAVKVTNANTGACTLNSNDTGVKALKHADGVDLVEGDLVAGQIFEARYDGTEYRIIAKESSAAGIKTLYESNTDTNEYSDAEKTSLAANVLKLSGIETAATADQTSSEIRSLVEAATDSNVFDDADHTKLDSLGSQSAKLNTKIMDIGDWDMSFATGSSFVSVAHGLTADNIRTVEALIRRDTTSTPIVPISHHGTASTYAGGSLEVSALTIVLRRRSTGFFDNTDYNATSFNRGWITIWYVD